MNDQNLFDELLRAAEQLGVAVRIEPFETPAVAGGGRCVFRGEQLILIDAHAPPRDRIGTLARALSELETDTVFMVPEAREVVEAMKECAREGREAQVSVSQETANGWTQRRQAERPRIRPF